MTASAALTSSTLKPLPDKWTARDGKQVVLESTPEQMILLSYTGDGWRVTRHAVERSEESNSRLRWCGTDYTRTGAPLANLAESDPPEKWKVLYRQLLSV